MATGAAFEKLAAIMARLRSPGGCPWDREQTLESLKPYLVEETYEVLEALDSDDPREHCLELGDLLLQIVFQAQIRSEEGHFELKDVADAISDKMERRHPHVFGDSHADTVDDVRQTWHQLKAVEKANSAGDQSAIAGIPKRLPALLRALRLGQKAANVGFDWSDISGPMAKLDEEQAELVAAIHQDEKKAIEHELGDCLFTLVNLCRHTDIDPEQALQAANDRFAARFRATESMVLQAGEEMQEVTEERLETYWEKAKKMS